MWRALKIFVLSLTHTLGLCKFMHTEPGKTAPWRSTCPVVDNILIILNPPRGKK